MSTATLRSGLDGRTWRDVVLAWFVVQWGSAGLWAVAAPRSFYDSFPGGGRQWVAVDGPFNEHLVRDVGGLFLALAALCVYALVARAPAAVRVAGIALLVSGVPHAVYHLATTEVHDSTLDAVASVAGLWAGVVAAAALVWSPTPDRHPVADGRTRSIRR